jgi:hypothetical protein
LPIKIRSLWIPLLDALCAEARIRDFIAEIPQVATSTYSTRKTPLSERAPSERTMFSFFASDSLIGLSLVHFPGVE